MDSAVYSQTTAMTVITSVRAVIPCCPKAEYCSDEEGFQHTYFVNKDKNLRHTISIHDSEDPNSIKADFDSLIGFELNGGNLKYLAFKKG